MRPIDFPEATTKLAKSQPQYRPLPVFIGKTDPLQPESLQFTFKYGLTDLEIEQIIKTRSIYFSQFGNCFHPVFASTESQFGSCPVQYRECLNSEDIAYYDFWIPLSNGTVHEIKACFIHDAMDKILEVAKLKPEQIVFIEKSALGIDENGNIVGL